MKRNHYLQFRSRRDTPYVIHLLCRLRRPLALLMTGVPQVLLQAKAQTAPKDMNMSLAQATGRQRCRCAAMAIAYA